MEFETSDVITVQFTANQIQRFQMILGDRPLKEVIDIWTTVNEQVGQQYREKQEKQAAMMARPNGPLPAVTT